MWTTNGTLGRRCLHDWFEQHQARAAAHPCRRVHHDGITCFGYATRAEFEADSYGWGKRDTQGCREIESVVRRGQDYYGLWTHNLR